MTSNARKRFDESAEDIDHLMDLYESMEILWKEDPETFPEGTEVLFRSAAVLMVSHWEAYVEDICSEALNHLVKHAKSASVLPKAVMQKVAAEVKGAPNELEVWKLADQGWREFLLVRLTGMKEGRDRGFNTPKSQPTAEFVKNVTGIDDVRAAWKFGSYDPISAAKKLDDLIAIRGEIAHRGRIRIKLDQDFVSEHVKLLRGLVSKTGGRINSHVKKITGKGLW